MRPRFARVIAAVALVAGAVLALPAGAHAQATLVPFAVPFQEGPIPVADTCAGPGVVGILTSSGTISGQVVITPAGQGLERVRIERRDRVAFPDGSYLLADLRERLGFVEDRQASVRTFGGTLLSRGTLYDAAGTVIGQEMVHHRFRITVAGGTPRVEFDVGFLTCR